MKAEYPNSFDYPESMIPSDEVFNRNNSSGRALDFPTVARQINKLQRKIGMPLGGDSESVLYRIEALEFSLSVLSDLRCGSQVVTEIGNIRISFRGGSIESYEPAFCYIITDAGVYIDLMAGIDRDNLMHTHFFVQCNDLGKISYGVLKRK